MSKKRNARRRTRNVLLIVSMMLVVAMASVGVTVAWLTAQTTTITNTFTTSDINITLTETKTDFKMVPGREIAKDPVVAVVDGSEACWLFVKVVKSDNYDSFMDGYTIADGWTELTEGSGIYYRQVAADAATKSFSVLKDDKVKVLNTVTKAQMNALNAENYPKLAFTAYAIQSEGITTAADAWAKLNPTT